MQNNSASRPVLISTYAHVYGKKVCRNIGKLKSFAPKEGGTYLKARRRLPARTPASCEWIVARGPYCVLSFSFSLTQCKYVYLFISIISLYQRLMSENSYLRIQGEAEDFPGWLNKVRWKGDRKRLYVSGKSRKALSTSPVNKYLTPLSPARYASQVVCEA